MLWPVGASTYPIIIILKLKMLKYSQHQSHWVSSTVHKELPAPPLSVWSASAGLSTPSIQTTCVSQWSRAKHGQTGEDKRVIHLLILHVIVMQTEIIVIKYTLSLRSTCSFDESFQIYKLKIIKVLQCNCTCFPRGDSSESPPIRPSMLWQLSPCRHR